LLRRKRKEAKKKRKRRCLSSTVVRLIKKSRDDHHDWCGEKIVWELKHKHGIVVSRSSVYRVLNRYFRARRKSEKAYIESFHRSLRKECLGWIKYKKKEKESLQV